jgi:hypothetical protein
MIKWRQAYFVAQLTYNLQRLFAAVLLFIQSFWLHRKEFHMVEIDNLFGIRINL